MAREHTYDTVVTWTGNRGTGTSGYRDYARDHQLTADGPDTIAGSSDPAFRGDKSRWNPEQLLVGSLSQCHMLWYLHWCANAGVVVTGYVDHAHGTMTETRDGGHFTEVVLRPQVTVESPSMVEAAMRLHADAHRACFIANSVNFPVRHQPSIHVEDTALELRPNCECCGVELPPESTEARICSFGCTFCRTCADIRLRGSCPNCCGGFTRRPIRPAALLVRYPAATKRVVVPKGC
jgi:organic hydroperoxide reductase OsmC/OhrA